MSKAKEKLSKDLRILEAMAADMDDYLRSQTLFYPLSDTSMPRLTLGGYLMRQHRLLALEQQLDDGEKDRLQKAVEQFNDALVEKIVRFEEKAHQELHARLRQWSEYLRDLNRESKASNAYYASAVDTRAMITALLAKLEMPPYKLDRRVLNELSAYDRALRNYWQAGDFIWAAEWQPAYPVTEYWWLYGRPRS